VTYKPVDIVALLALSEQEGQHSSIAIVQQWRAELVAELERLAEVSVEHQPGKGIAYRDAARLVRETQHQ
jgi:L-amino acid N-acyltransferase YncA